jgi:hypothetical protein
MRIRKWDGSAWTALSPKVTYTDIVADVTAANPVSIFPSGKLGLTYLPDAVFGGMKFVGTVGYNSNALDTLEKLIQGGSTNWSISSSLDSFTSKSYSNGDYAGIGQQYIGYYWVVQNSVTLGVSDSAGGAADFADEATDDGQDQLGTAPFTLSVEHGDWLIITGWDNTNSKFLFSVVNNTYTQATSSSSGVLKLGSSTVQSVGANSVSSTSGRTYAVQVNSSGQAVVNVPWSDTNTNTFRTVTAGGNTLGSTETLAFTAGSNVTITESGGAVTIAATDTNTTYSTATSSTLGLVKIGYTENGKNYPVELSSGQMFVNVPWTDTNTNTTYSAGSGIALAGTTFSVAGGVGLTQEASGLKMENPIEIGTATPASGYQITNGALWFDLN